jgi:hypothetical protein
MVVGAAAEPGALAKILVLLLALQVLAAQELLVQLPGHLFNMRVVEAAELTDKQDGQVALLPMAAVPVLISTGRRLLQPTLEAVAVLVEAAVVAVVTVARE